MPFLSIAQLLPGCADRRSDHPRRAPGGVCCWLPRAFAGYKRLTPTNYFSAALWRGRLQTGWRPTTGPSRAANTRPPKSLGRTAARVRGRPPFALPAAWRLPPPLTSTLPYHAPFALPPRLNPPPPSSFLPHHRFPSVLHLFRVLWRALLVFNLRLDAQQLPLHSHRGGHCGDAGPRVICGCVEWLACACPPPPPLPP